MLDCLASRFVHDVSQGDRRSGKKKFAEFLDHMHATYHEQLSDIVVMTNADGSRASAEFNLKGKYLNTDEGLPPARDRNTNCVSGHSSKSGMAELPGYLPTTIWQIGPSRWLADHGSDR